MLRTTRKSIVKAILFLLVFMVIVYSTSISLHAVESSALHATDKTIDFVSIATSFIEQLPNAEINSNSIKINSEIKLNSLQNGAFYAYLIDVEDKNGNCAYFVINATTGNVIEFAENASPIATSKYSVISAQSFYYSPLDFWAVGPNGICVNATNGTTANLFDIVGTSASPFSERTVERYINGIEFVESSSGSVSITTYPTFNYILNVPDYQQSGGYYCINTSILNVIAYWDNNGLPDLITGTIDQARADIQACLVAEDGPGANSSIPGAISRYATAHGNYYSDVWNIWHPEFFDLQFEINYQDPCLVGFPTYYGGGHMTTGVGYNTIDGIDYAIVHDNHYNTPYDVVIAFSEVDFIASISILDLS